MYYIQIILAVLLLNLNKTFGAAAPEPAAANSAPTSEQDKKGLAQKDKKKGDETSESGSSSSDSSEEDKKKKGATRATPAVMVQTLAKPQNEIRTTPLVRVGQINADTKNVALSPELAALRKNLQITLSTTVQLSTPAIKHLQENLEQALKEAASLNPALGYVAEPIATQPASVAMRPTRPFDPGYNRFDERSHGGPSPHVLANRIMHRMQRINDLSQQISQYKQQRPLINGVSIAQHMQRIQQQLPQDLATATRQLEKQLEKQVGVFEEKYDALKAKCVAAEENLQKEVALLFPKGVPEGVDTRQHILQRGSRLADEALIAADEAQLELMQFEDGIAFCKAAIELNKQQLKNHATSELERSSAKNEQAVTREEHEKVLAELMMRHEKLRITNTKRNTEINDLRVEYGNVVEQIENTWFWGKSALLEQKTRLEAQLDGLVPLQLVKQAEFEALHEAVAEHKERIRSFDRDNASRLRWAEQGDATIEQLSAVYGDDQKLIAAIKQTQQDNGAVHAATYALNPSVTKLLTKSGVDTKHMTQFAGNKLQLYVHGQLIDSLNGIETITSSDVHVATLLQDAVAINIVGQRLNSMAHIPQALLARKACDAVVEYAKTVADLGAAVGEGVRDGVIDTADTVWHITKLAGKAAHGMLTDPTQTIERVQAKLQLVRDNLSNAAIAIGHLATDAESLEKVLADLKEELRNKPAREYVRLAAKFVTECGLQAKLLSIARKAKAIGKAARGAGHKSQDMLKAARSFIKNPRAVLAKEAAVIWGHWRDLEKAVVHGREYAKINGRLFTRHAIERMSPKGYGESWLMGIEGRGVPISVVEDVIKNGVISETRIGNNVTRICKAIDRVSVVLENDIVISVLIKT